MSVEWGGSYGTSYADGLRALRRVNRKIRLAEPSAREQQAQGEVVGASRLPEDATSPSSQGVAR